MRSYPKTIWILGFSSIVHMSTELIPESDITMIIFKWDLLILSLALIYSLEGSSSFPQDFSRIHLYTFILMLFQKFLLCLEVKSLLLI